jgi:peptidoglycan/LPS O-acetylase OafA/YrhL
MKSTSDRFMQLEGLRVVAAIVVIFFHASLIFYPSMTYGISPTAPLQHMRFEDNVFQNPLAGIFSGTFAVSIFFVLSAFVLSVGFFTKKDPMVVKRLAAKRYLRLMPPALASILLIWALTTLGLSHGIAKTVQITQSNWLGSLWNFIPNLGDALWQGIVTVFSTSGILYYNPVLWTIHWEFIGSFIIFAFSLLFYSSKYRWIPYTVLFVGLINTWLIGFVLGMILADLYVNRKTVFDALNNKLVYLFIPFAVFFAGYPTGIVSVWWYKALTIPSFTALENQSMYTAFAATLLVTAILAIPRLSNIFAWKKLSQLGKYTYASYLVHIPVLFTLCTALFAVFIRHMGYNRAAVLATLVSFIVIMAVTYLFERFIDAPSIRFSSWCADLFFGVNEFEDGRIKRILHKFSRRGVAFEDEATDNAP